MDQPINRFEKSAKIVFYVLIALLPIWFVPFPVGIDVGREITFGVLILAAVILALLSALTRGEIRFNHSAILYAAVLVLVVVGVSAAFSKMPMESFLFSDSIGERFSTLVMGILLMALVGSVFTSHAEIGTAFLLLVGTSALTGIITAVQLLLNTPIYGQLFSFVADPRFSAIGTLNAAAIFYAVIFLMLLGLFASSSLAGWKRWMRVMLGCAAVIFFINLLLINFQTAWIAFIGGSIMLVGLLFRSLRARTDGGPMRRFGGKQWLVVLVLIAAIVMSIVRQPLVKRVSVPIEVSPSLTATLKVAASVFVEGPKAMLLGSGPGTFGFDWARYKDPLINQTIFWGVRFIQGSSLAATLLATTGLIGFLAFLLFVGLLLFLFLKLLLFADEETSLLATGLFGGFVALLIAQFLYPANLTLLMLFFAIAGLLMYVLAHRDASEGASGYFDFGQLFMIHSRTVRFEGPWASFLSSLVIIFLLALGVAGLNLEATRVRALYATAHGMTLFGKGDIDGGVASFENAARIESYNVQNFQQLVQARIEKIRNIIDRASKGEQVGQDFQAAVSAAVQDSQAMLQLEPDERDSWSIQGALYEMVIPYIQGAEQLASQSYQRAVVLDQLNPALWVDLGRAGLVYADRIQALMNQAAAGDRPKLADARIGTLKEVEKAFTQAATLKPDYAPAHFLLAQVALRLGNTQGAIASTENAKRAAPFDIGIAFQLGLLYYQTNDLPHAQAEFERALTINDNYSNARYFLGLIYDRQGDKSKAIEQFEKVVALNPDNTEVAHILANLRAGKPALASIVPPAAAPEKRKDVPVSQQGETKRSRR